MKIQIILGSTRPGREVVKVGKWVAAAASDVEGFEVETVDLADYALPFFNEAISPRYNPDRKPEAVVQSFMDKLASADGFIFVTPEYNHSIPGVLKNALDYLTSEMVHKPAAIVSYGTVGGARSAEHLKTILLEIRAGVVPEATALVGMPSQVMNEDGVLNADVAANPYGPAAALQTTLTELAWWTRATKAAQAELAAV